MDEKDILNNLLFKLCETINEDEKIEIYNYEKPEYDDDEQPKRSEEKPESSYENEEPPPIRPRSLLNFLKDAIPTQNEKSIISFIDPRIGIAFDESMLDINDSSIEGSRNHHMFSNLVNSIPPTSGFFTKTDTTIDQVAKMVLKQSQIAKGPDSLPLIKTFQTLSGKMDIDQRQSDMGTFLPVFYIPGTPERIHWNKFNFNPNQDHQYDEIKNRPCSTPPSSFVPPIEDNQDYHILCCSSIENQDYKSSEVENICLSAEIARISIYRNWWEPLIFESRLWKFNDNNLFLSNGENPASGLMPLFISSIILCKNLKIKNIPPDEIDNSEFISYGPFRIKNDTIKPTVLSPSCPPPAQSSRGAPKLSDIESDSMQILGFICEKINKSPNPDEQKQWE